MNYFQMLTVLTIGAGAVAFGCRGTAPAGNGSKLASFSITPSPDVVVGKEYDEIQVKTQHLKADKTYDTWIVAKAWPSLTESNKSASLEDSVKVTPGTYRINVIYLKAGATIASGSDTLKECIIKQFELSADKPNKVAVDACKGVKQPADDSKPKDPEKVETGDASVVITSNIVNSGGSTAGNGTGSGNGSGSISGNGSGSTAGNGSSSATPPAAQGLDYPKCPDGIKASSPTNPLWGWIVDASLCATGKQAKIQIDQKMGGCSCSI